MNEYGNKENRQRLAAHIRELRRLDEDSVKQIRVALDGRERG